MSLTLPNEERGFLQSNPRPLREQADEAVGRIHAVLDDYETVIEDVVINRLLNELEIRRLERERRNDPAWYRHRNGAPLPLPSTDPVFLRGK